MLYEAKQGTKAYKYIKSILDAEFEEHQAYMKRVEEAVGFKFEKYQGYQPNRTLTRVYEITAIWVPSERYDTLDKKVWKKIDGVKLEDGYYVAIAPNKRYKQGKAIASVLLSYKSVANHFKVMKELNIEVSQASRFSITQLLRHKDRIFVYFDDSIRAEKQNQDFVEITIGEYEDFVNKKDQAMDKLEYIPGDLVMTNGVPLGTARYVVYRVTSSDPTKALKLDDGTVLKGVVYLENIEGAEFGEKGYLSGDCCAWVKDIVPINLVPAILEKNGWKVSSECKWIYVKEDNVKIFRLLDDIHYAAYIGFVRLLEFQHIHQLQHLLFGLELNSEMEV